MYNKVENEKFSIKEFFTNLLTELVEDPEGFYISSLGVIQYEAIEKKIEFNDSFQKKREKEFNHEITFDSEYFENRDQIELYVFSAALIDPDIFDYLECVWSLAKSEYLTEKVLFRELYFLKEKGVRF